MKRIELNSRKEETECNCYFVEEDNTVTATQNDTPLEKVNIEGTSSDVPQEKIWIGVGVQVKSGDLSSPCFFNFLKTGEELSTATGIQIFKLADNIVAAVEIAAPQLSKHNSVLSIRERVLMTFMKLKHNLSYSFLTILFPAVNSVPCQFISPSILVTWDHKLRILGRSFNNAGKTSTSKLLIAGPMSTNPNKICTNNYIFLMRHILPPNLQGQ